jgi:hypothetical protein
MLPDGKLAEYLGIPPEWVGERVRRIGALMYHYSAVSNIGTTWMPEE